MPTETTTRKAALDAIYQALREDQTGTLPRHRIGVGALDLNRSSIVLRVEALLAAAPEDAA